MSTPIVRIEGKKLIITVDLEENPRPSSSGKSLLLASTGGSPNSGFIHPQFKKPIMVQLSAYIKNAAPAVTPAQEAEDEGHEPEDETPAPPAKKSKK